MRVPLPLITLKENALMAMETLGAQKMRTFLTMLGVFIGVVIVTAIASVMNGFRDNLVDTVRDFGTTTMFIHRFPLINRGRPDRSLRNRKPLTLDDALAVRDLCPAIEALTPCLEAPPGNLAARAGGERMENPFLRGAFPSAVRAWNLAVREGRFFNEAEEAHRMEVAVIGDKVAEALFSSRPSLEKDIVVSGLRLRVIGVLEKHKEGPMGDGNHEDQIIWMPYGAFHRHFPGLEDNLIVAAARPGLLNDAVEQVTEVLRRRRKVRWDQENNFEVATATSIIETFDQIVFGAVAVMVILSSVAFMVGGVGVMNIMLCSVKERTREIGMRKAIGARRRDIAWQFLIEAMVLTGTGGLLGILFTDLLGVVVRSAWEGLPLSTPVWARVAGFAGSVSVGLVFGIWPAVKAARLDPIIALHYE